MKDTKEIELNYLKDSDGNYILKNVHYDNEYDKEEIINTGEMIENWIISTKFFNRKLQHKLDEAIKDIENTMLIQNRITMDDIIWERMTLNITPETEFNPMFENMSEKEIQAYTRHSIKIRVHITFEFHIKQKSHLWLSSHFNELKKLFKK